MYAFFDKESEMYDTPFFTLDELNAKRHFQLVTQKPGTMLNTFITSFELYYLGEFDKGKGIMKLEERPALVMTGNQLVQQLHSQRKQQPELFDA